MSCPPCHLSDYQGQGPSHVNTQYRSSDIQDKNRKQETNKLLQPVHILQHWQFNHSALRPDSKSYMAYPLHSEPTRHLLINPLMKRQQNLCIFPPLLAPPVHPPPPPVLLYHYTSKESLAAILRTGAILPSLPGQHPTGMLGNRDVRAGAVFLTRLDPQHSRERIAFNNYR